MPASPLPFLATRTADETSGHRREHEVSRPPNTAPASGYYGRVPRIELITQKADLPADRHAEFDAIVEVLHRVGGPFAILMRSPGLAQKVMEAGAHVRLQSTLKPVEREL